VIAMAGVGMAACSSTTNVQNPLPNAEGGGGDGQGGPYADGYVPPGDDSGNPGDDGPNPGDGGSSGDCGKVATLHENDGAVGPYCPFADAGTIGKHCPALQECCVPHFPQDKSPQVCLAQGADCTPYFTVPEAGIPVDCEEDNQCPSGKVCCVTMAAFGQDPGCTNYFGSKLKGAFCVTACAAGQFHVCQNQSECTSGTTCTPFRDDGRDWGACK
jgi:hypothetical protein